MQLPDGFYTLKGYQRSTDAPLTTAMEDYLEMICRLADQQEAVRVVRLSQMLHVRASSVTKMVHQLCNAGFLTAERYGLIRLTEKGRAAGSYLLYRHAVIQRFLRVLNGSEDELEEAEKIEHFLSHSTVENLERLTQCLCGGCLPAEPGSAFHPMRLPPEG